MVVREELHPIFTLGVLLHWGEDIEIHRRVISSLLRLLLHDMEGLMLRLRWLSMGNLFFLGWVLLLLRRGCLLLLLLSSDALFIVLSEGSEQHHVLSLGFLLRLFSYLRFDSWQFLLFFESISATWNSCISRSLTHLGDFALISFKIRQTHRGVGAV